LIFNVVEWQSFLKNQNQKENRKMDAWLCLVDDKRRKSKNLFLLWALPLHQNFISQLLSRYFLEKYLAIWERKGPTFHWYWILTKPRKIIVQIGAMTLIPYSFISHDWLFWFGYNFEAEMTIEWRDSIVQSHSRFGFHRPITSAEFIYTRKIRDHATLQSLFLFLIMERILWTCTWMRDRMHAPTMAMMVWRFESLHGSWQTRIHSHEVALLKIGST